MSTERSIRPRRAFAVACAAAALAAAPAIGAGAASAHDMPVARSTAAASAKAQALHDDMRALWEAHGTWTERAIVDFVGGLPDTQLVIARLLHNQEDIGNAIKPYYGGKAGDRLTALLKGHINAAVAVLQAAKSGDDQAVAAAKKRFYANGRQVADFLHAANPRHWATRAMRTMMRVHLDQVVELAVDQLQGRLAAGIKLYDTYIAHILDMADMLSDGIVQQFPARFR